MISWRAITKNTWHHTLASSGACTPLKHTHEYIHIHMFMHTHMHVNSCACPLTCTHPLSTVFFLLYFESFEYLYYFIAASVFWDSKLPVRQAMTVWAEWAFLHARSLDSLLFLDLIYFSARFVMIGLLSEQASSITSILNLFQLCLALHLSSTKFPAHYLCLQAGEFLLCCMSSW